MTQTVRVELGARSYSIVIAPALIDDAGVRLREAGMGRRCLVVTHHTLADVYGERLLRSLADVGFEAQMTCVPEGEQSKCIAMAEQLYDAAAQAGLSRSSALIALGGGVIGDLTGFVAATYMRGIAFVQIPTSLLAQVDASVGGKVAVDHRGTKNLIGAFHQPAAVLIDTDTLRTLPERHYRAGLAEVVKYGVIADAAFFAYLEDHVAQLLDKETEAVAHIVRRSCELKAEVVAADEHDLGLRAILNYGHTAGHALEAAAGLTVELLHGEAVAIGMMVAAHMAEELGRIDAAAVERQRLLLERVGLPVTLRAAPLEPLLELMQLDKKTIDGRLRFVLPSAIGAVDIVEDIDPAVVVRALEKVFI